MLGLFRLARGRAAPPVRRARLNLEWLEDRDVPSTSPTTTLTLAIVPSGVDKTVTVSGDLKAALVSTGTTNSSSTAPGTMLAGTAPNDPILANQTIDLGGVVTGTVVTDAGGHFTKTLLASSLGAATAWADDGSSNTATANLVVAAPVIDTIQGVEEPGAWVFSGHVTGYNPGSLVITLSGLASVQNIQVNVDANGNFSTAVILNGTATDDGWLRANTTDVWGQNSNQALFLVFQTH